MNSLRALISETLDVSGLMENDEVKSTLIKDRL
jgi:hypothetical protein